VIRVFVVYEGEPGPERYAEHVELCRKVDGATFRHGKVFGAPPGSEQAWEYYAEFEFPDMAAFQAAARSSEFVQTGVDAMAMGIPMRVHFADVS